MKLTPERLQAIAERCERDTGLSPYWVLQLFDHIAAVEAERDAERRAVMAWVRENAPGGWIDNLREAVGEKK